MNRVETSTNTAGWKAVAVFTYQYGERRLFHHAIYAPDDLIESCHAHGDYSPLRPDQIAWFPVGQRCPACAAADADRFKPRQSSGGER